MKEFKKTLKYSMYKGVTYVSVYVIVFNLIFEYNPDVWEVVALAVLTDIIIFESGFFDFVLKRIDMIRHKAKSKNDNMPVEDAFEEYLKNGNTGILIDWMQQEIKDNDNENRV